MNKALHDLDEHIEEGFLTTLATDKNDVANREALWPKGLDTLATLDTAQRDIRPEEDNQFFLQAERGPEKSAHPSRVKSSSSDGKSVQSVQSLGGVGLLLGHSKNGNGQNGQSQEKTPASLPVDFAPGRIFPTPFPIYDPDAVPAHCPYGDDLGQWRAARALHYLSLAHPGFRIVNAGPDAVMLKIPADAPAGLEPYAAQLLEVALPYLQEIARRRRRP